MGERADGYAIYFPAALVRELAADYPAGAQWGTCSHNLRPTKLMSMLGWLFTSSKLLIVRFALITYHIMRGP